MTCRRLALRVTPLSDVVSASSGSSGDSLASGRRFLELQVDQETLQMLQTSKAHELCVWPLANDPSDGRGHATMICAPGRVLGSILVLCACRPRGETGGLLSQGFWTRSPDGPSGVQAETGALKSFFGCE